MDPPETARQHEDLDADGTIAVDVPCIQCGYNVRALNVEDRCPECGHSILDSLEATHEDLAKERFDSGIPFLIWALAGPVVMALGVAAAVTGVSRQSGAPALIIGVINAVFVLVVSIGLAQMPPRRHRWAAICALVISGCIVLVVALFVLFVNVVSWLD